MVKRAVLLAVSALVFPLMLIGAGDKSQAPEAAAYVLIEAETGTVLEEHNAREQLNAGYLSKLMSLLLIAEDIETGKYGPDTVLTASESVRGTKGAVVWLEPGDSMTVDELLKSVVVGNANDALTVLIEASEYKKGDFLLRMNAEAFDMGLRDTAFYSPYGYYDEREHTTAADIAVICAKLSQCRQLEGYFAIWRDHVRDGKVELVSENHLTRTYKRHIGFKASHSQESGWCISEGARSEEGTCYVSVVLGATDNETAHKKARQLCDKGFSDYKVTATMFPDEMLRPVRVKHGVDTAVGIRLASQSGLVLPRGAGELKTVVVLPEYLDAPVKKGQAIGTAAFYHGKTLVYESDIVACESVKALSLDYVMRQMLLKMIE